MAKDKYYEKIGTKVLEADIEKIMRKQYAKNLMSLLKSMEKKLGDPFEVVKHQNYAEVADEFMKNLMYNNAADLYTHAITWIERRELQEPGNKEAMITCLQYLEKLKEALEKKEDRLQDKYISLVECERKIISVGDRILQVKDHRKSIAKREDERRRQEAEKREREREERRLEEEKRKRQEELRNLQKKEEIRKLEEETRKMVRELHTTKGGMSVERLIRLRNAIQMSSEMPFSIMIKTLDFKDADEFIEWLYTVGVPGLKIEFGAKVIRVESDEAVKKLNSLIDKKK